MQIRNKWYLVLGLLVAVGAAADYLDEARTGLTPLRYITIGIFSFLALVFLLRAFRIKPR